MVKTMAGKRHDYFEGILQLRDCTEEFVEGVITDIRASGKCQIAKILPEKRGVDIYVSDQHYIQALGKSLKYRFGGELLSTKKLFGRHSKHGKIVYRVTVLFRRIPFSVGDIIETEDGQLKILSIKNKIQVQNLKSGKKELLRFEQIARWAR